MIRVARPAVVRATIARAVLGEDHDTPIRIGRVTLRSHQRAAMARVQALLARNGGAMLADRVGLGKTYVAAAVASRMHGEVLIVAPAALRTMWHDALEACAVDARIVTHEALSRGATVAGAPHLIVRRRGAPIPFAADATLRRARSWLRCGAPALAHRHARAKQSIRSRGATRAVPRPARLAHER